MNLKHLSALFVCMAAMVATAFPLLVSAQQDDLRMAIQTSVLADPRTASIPPSQLNELVDALAEQAQAHHLSAADILWRPKTAEASTSGPAEGAAVPDCAEGWYSYLCQVNTAFGFAGNDLTIPILLLITSGLLVLVIQRMIAHHHKRIAASKGTPPPWENMPQ